MPTNVNVVLKGLPQGNAELHYAAKLEPYRQGLTPRPAPLQSKAVEDGTLGTTWGNVTFTLTPGLQYLVFGSDGKGRLVMAGMSRPNIDTVTPAAGTTPKTVVLDGYGFTISSRARVDGKYVQTRFKSDKRLEADLPAVAAGARVITVENAGYVTNAVTYTAS